jgi:hypothetical protein
MSTLAAITLIIGTLHSAPGFNDVNPGVLLHAKGALCEPTAGAYYNSERRASILVGCRLVLGDRAGLHGSLTAGAVTGYANRPLPFVIPTVSYGGFNASLLPPPSWVGQRSRVTGINFSYTVELQ